MHKSSFVYKMPLIGMVKWPHIGGWLPIKVAAHSRMKLLEKTKNFHAMTSEKQEVNWPP